MYRWLDVYLCGRYRILPPDCNAGVSSLLGSSHAEPSTGGGSAATGREVASRGGYGIAVTRRVRDLACCAMAGVACCRNSFDWIVLWPYLPDDPGHCRGPLFAARRNGVWAAVFDCADWRHDISLGVRSGFTASQRSRRHDCAGAGSSLHYWIIPGNNVARASPEGDAEA